ncbi:MAG: hypothetical protein CL867_07185 [Cytophagaceae bacterium]|nr:hypothetical protein [Cytophagaceae bacterium]
MRFYCILFFLLGAPAVFAQKKNPKDSIPDGWRSGGVIALLFNQSAFNAEWQGGGTSNIAGSLNASYDLNYKKKSFSWDTKVIVDYGQTKIKDQAFSRKTSDRFEINSTVGSRIKNTNWNYSVFINFTTQLGKGFVFFEKEVFDDQGELIEEVPARREVTRFFSPAYLQGGPGFLWKKSNNYKINIAPASARLIMVNKMFTRVDRSDPEALAAYTPYFGVEANESLRFELGASMRAYAKFELMENILMENILSLYSDYIESPENVDVDYTLNLALTVNKFVTANFTFQAIYDDNAVNGLQVREVIGLGFKYTIP